MSVRKAEGGGERRVAGSEAGEVGRAHRLGKNFQLSLVQQEITDMTRAHANSLEESRQDAGDP